MYTAETTLQISVLRQSCFTAKIIMKTYNLECFISYLGCVGCHDCLFFDQNPKVGKIPFV